MESLMNYAFFLLVLFSSANPVVRALNYASLTSHGYRYFMLQWTYDNNTLIFNMTCQAVGWCAVGFTESFYGVQMINYDIAAGGVDSNTNYLKDYWSYGPWVPLQDASQDLTLIEASEVDGYTSVNFKRPAITGDTDKDVQFTDDTWVFIVWAMHSTNDVPSGLSSPKHTTWGMPGDLHNLISEAKAAIAAQPPGMSVSSSDGNFTMSWMYNGIKLHFNMTCKTLGWCAVGLTTSPDGKGMKYYDIALGGVASNMTYIYDYWSTTTAKPLRDAKQNLMAIEGSENGGYTSVQFSRDPLTDDPENDVQYTFDTNVWIAWAMNTAEGNSDISKHTAKGILPNRYNLLMGMMSPPITTAPSTEPSTAPSTALSTTPLQFTTKKSAAGVAESRVVFVTIHCLFALFLTGGWPC